MGENGNTIGRSREIDSRTDNNSGVTNVLNTTVNNNTFTTTIACIDYMWKNSKLFMFIGGCFVSAFLILIIMFGVSINKINSISDQDDDKYIQLNNKLDGVNGYIEALAASTEEASEKSAIALERVEKNENDIRTLTEKQKNSNVSKDENKADEKSIDIKTIVTKEESINNIYNLKMVSHRNAECKRVANNTLGDELKEVIYLYGSEDAHVTYYLGGKYSRISVNVCCPDEERITEALYPMQIYADNDEKKELYSMNFGRNTAVTPIEIDVSGVDFITFKVSKNSVLYDKCGMIISNGTLE